MYYIRSRNKMLIQKKKKIYYIMSLILHWIPGKRKAPTALDEVVTPSKVIRSVAVHFTDPPPIASPSRLFSASANVPSVDKVQDLASSHNSGKNSCVQSGRTRSGIFGTVLGDAMVLPTHQTKGKGKATYIMRSPHGPVGNALDDITGYVSAGLNYDSIYDFGNYSDIQLRRSATPIDVSNIYPPLPVIGTLKYPIPLQRRDYNNWRYSRV
jgi:hypothetical protein